MAARRQIIKPEPPKPPLNKERIDRLELLLANQLNRFDKWMTKSSRATKVVFDARAQVKRLERELAKERNGGA
jgi:hypothetical protein